MISLDTNRLITPKAPISSPEDRCGARGYIRIHRGGLTELFRNYISFDNLRERGETIQLNRGSLIDYLNAYNQEHGIDEEYTKGILGWFGGTSDQVLKDKYLAIVDESKKKEAKEKSVPSLNAQVQLCDPIFFSGKPDAANFTPIQTFYETHDQWQEKKPAVQIWTQTLDTTLIVRIDVRDGKHLTDHLSELLSNEDFIASLNGKTVVIHVNSPTQEMSKSLVKEIKSWQRGINSLGFYYSAPLMQQRVESKKPADNPDKRLTPNRTLLRAEVAPYEKKFYPSETSPFALFQTFPGNAKTSGSEPEIRILTRRLPNRDLILRIDIEECEGEPKNLGGVLNTIAYDEELIQESLISRKVIICVNSTTSELDKKIVPLIQTWQQNRTF